MVDNSTMVVDPILSLEGIVANTGAATVNETSSSENSKMNDMENVMTRKSSLEDFEVTATEYGSDYGSEPHICDQCGRGFKEISSLNGHMCSHRREEYKCIRMMSKQSIPVEASHTEAARTLKHFWGSSKALVEMSTAHAWNPKYGTASIDLSASVTLSSDAHSSKETVEMREAAEFITILADRNYDEIVTVPLPRSVEGTVLCAICNKAFSSYQALGCHMSIHSKPKNSLLGDGTGTSNDSGERGTWKYACRKCNERFPTQKSLGGHTRRHWQEAFKMTSSTDEKNWKPPVPLPLETMQSSGPVVLPTDESMQPPVLLASDNVQPTRLELSVSNATVNQLLQLDFDASQKQHDANRLGNETEQSSGVPKALVDMAATLPAPMMIPPAKRCLPDLNMMPHEDDDDEP
ncbi:unnamed protein product [Urochloa decumbens]|uniref:C2H2-type domain-containing protein n=1 Tax=Urochloa decumbens TaxID=240449 RepID=A0ABC9B7F6_9POAL